MDEDNKPVENDSNQEEIVDNKPSAEAQGEKSTGEAEDQNPDENQEGEKEEISEDPVEDDKDKEEPPVSKRESKRIQQLLDKFAERDKARYSDEPRRTPEPKRDDSGKIIPEGEYDIDEINKMAQTYAEKYGEDRYKQAMSESQMLYNANTFATRLEIDVPRVNSKYTFLDNESQDFNAGVASFVNRMYLNAVDYNPQTGVVQDSNLRYGEFVEGFMEAVELMSTEKVADTTKNVAQQAARTGIRPGGSRKPSYGGDDPRQMTDEQLEQVINDSLGIKR